MNARPDFKPPPGSTINWSHPLARGLILCCPFNGVGDARINAAEPGVSGSWGTTPWLTGSKGLSRNYAAATGSKDDYVSSKVNISSATQLTLMMLAEHSGGTSVGLASLVCKSESSANYAVIGTGASNTFNCRFSGTGTGDTSGTSGAFPTGSPVIYGATWNAGSVAVYRNGVLDRTGTAATAMLADMGQFYSRYQFNPLRVFGFWVWNRALVASECAWHFSDPWAVFDWPKPKKTYLFVPVAATSFLLLRRRRGLFTGINT